MQHHIIVSGDDALATTIIEELESAGANVIRLGSSGLTGVCDELEQRPRRRRAGSRVRRR